MKISKHWLSKYFILDILSVGALPVYECDPNDETNTSYILDENLNVKKHNNEFIRVCLSEIEFIDEEIFEKACINLLLEASSNESIDNIDNIFKFLITETKRFNIIVPKDYDFNKIKNKVDYFRVLSDSSLDVEINHSKYTNKIIITPSSEFMGVLAQRSEYTLFKEDDEQSIFSILINGKNALIATDINIYGVGIINSQFVYSI